MSNKYMSPWIFTTTNCNLKCPYCYVKQDNQYMTKEVYERMNDIFLKMLETGEKDTIIYRLAGGEPLLAFDKWKDPIKDFIEKSGDKGFVAVVTNLTILTDEMLEYFKDLPIGFGVSLDGYSYSKAFPNGNSSAEIVKKNIDKLLAIGKEVNISTVIDERSFNDIEKLAEWIAERDLEWGINLDHFLRDKLDINDIILKMISVLDILDSKGYDIGRKFKFGNIKLTTSYEGCTAGEKLITVFTNGDVYPCQTTIYKEKICNIFNTDDIIGELKRQNKYKLGYRYELPEQCKACSISNLCGGGCKENNNEINKNYTCDILKAVLFYMMKLEIRKGE